MDNFSYITNQNDNPECLQPLANFQPALGQHNFLNYTPLDEVAENQTKQEIEELKELVWKELVSDNKNSKERLMYIDAIQRLGVAYHFEDEIEYNLVNYFHNMEYNDDCFKNDLHYVSLRFCILRQHGFHVSSDVFDKLKNEEGRFKEENDVEAMLSLYEALDLRAHGEETLDKAVAYTHARLESFTSDDLIDRPMVDQVARALELPLFKRSHRLESMYQISIYGSESSHDDNLIKLAKLDFNLLQSLHKTEIRDLLRWSNELELGEKLPYVRDRLLEANVWMLGVYSEPKYSYARMLCNKLFKLITIVDDTYDAYGVVHELQLFTDAIQRWDKSCGSKLPEYMKFIYDVILGTCEEFENDLARQGRSFAVDYVRFQMKAMCRSYMQEAKWCHEKYVPTFDEYMRNGIVSSGYYYVITAVILGMREIASKDAFEWIYQSSKSVRASCVLARS